MLPDRVFSQTGKVSVEDKMSGEKGTETSLIVKPIAIVKNNVNDLGRRAWKTVVSEIVFEPEFEESLYGIDDFSHIVVLVWFDRSPRWQHGMSKTHPQKRPELPLVGILSTRSPVRPNPLGVSVVRLLEREGNILRVIGLDAINNTPVLDIKPYIPEDLDHKIRVPEWIPKLKAD